LKLIPMNAKEIYDEHADLWVRRDPILLSDYSARPRVLQLCGNVQGKTILDLGCGYGPIACALAVRSPGSRIWAIDVNERALDLCRRNARAAGLENMVVTSPDGVPPDVRFDAIYANPPIRIGKPALHDLLTRWLGVLTHDGTAHLVVQRHLGADSLARWLTDQGWPTVRRASRKGFRLLDVTAADKPPADGDGGGA